VEPPGIKRFYDIHFHAFNLSHPDLTSFVKRFILDNSKKLVLITTIVFVLIIALNRFQSILLPVILIGLISVIYICGLILLLFPSRISTCLFDLFARVLRRPLNTIALMENDLGNYFLLAERELRENVLIQGKLKIEDTLYDKIVVTPLMMDFGNKNIFSKRLPYAKYPVSKPIVQQVTDLFNGVHRYLKKTHERGEAGIFEIYPFLGINTQNYTVDEITELLEKYFKDYRGSETELCQKMGSFSGNIDEMNSNFFAGIKVYPPLGFDPMPTDQNELEKVRALYGYCVDKGIPITSHCSDGGFRVDSFLMSNKRTSPDKWKSVLKKFPKLKLNLAHMGRQGKMKTMFLPRYRKQSWTDTVFDLIAEYENCYTDFSCRGFDNKYYRQLRNLIERKSLDLSPVLAGKQYKLEDKILFGSDFMINLLWIDSYSKYLKVFQGTSYFSKEAKEKFCCNNPMNFLFASVSE
jgi:hypothetical protein